MKFFDAETLSANSTSPSMRREWIEILDIASKGRLCLSPSMRREWIEICPGGSTRQLSAVSLHAEGVD